jgi:hypothetical protein
MAVTSPFPFSGTASDAVSSISRMSRRPRRLCGETSGATDSRLDSPPTETASATPRRARGWLVLGSGPPPGRELGAQQVAGEARAYDGLMVARPPLVNIAGTLPDETTPGPRPGRACAMMAGARESKPENHRRGAEDAETKTHERIDRENHRRGD